MGGGVLGDGAAAEARRRERRRGADIARKRKTDSDSVGRSGPEAAQADRALETCDGKSNDPSWSDVLDRFMEYSREVNGEPLGAEFGRGFLCSGLWRYSRHPNYFCEVAIWWAFYLFSLAAGLPLVNWTISGAAFLTCLFVLPHASLDVTEVLPSRKYPQYAEYQATVSRFFPLPPLPAGERAPMRPVDAVLIGWFCVGLAVTFLVDIEAVLVQRPDLYGLDAAHTPLWPPEPCVRAVRWWSAAADPLMHARPVWFRAAIWVEVLVQAPFYAVAIYAFVRQRSWVRVPAIVYATVLLTIMPIVLAEQYFGPHASRRPLLVTAVYGAYVLMPVLLLVRVWSVDVFPSTPLAKRKAAGLAGGEAAAPAASRTASPLAGEEAGLTYVMHM
ncbi:hypothetical protein EMIHUDRAFT_217878 [Emiliania huxleyi CCMP1516]|uniref:EXPERA domain-containing protein n=2 Tax=Emiliania huxleyi TaxID=2903 RepID=A0A0D3I9G4_EMIH1|nr:hypothetical protein EMIHUDRAFT_217878 [Emiliania huxleyi CCMP1516]EOD07899.1 hypothetical protein EMIHUDRAFT_217878 [Emiliania huxleyi CCMP1516]|eukprot:XP_005760328.1 hypothetical protein EMIHUDRAFT_217878 [Emiliania huxleyi CCMP1516]